MENNTSIKRIYLLFRRNVLLHNKNLLITVGGVLALVFFAYIIGGYSKMNTQDFHAIFLALIIIIGGLIYTSLAFNDLSNRSKGILYLTLPAKRVEKLFEAFFRTLIIYPVLVYIVYFIYSILLNALGLVIFGIPFKIFNPFDGVTYNTLITFMFLHSMFFLGAVVFPKNSFLKTVLALFVISNIVMLISAFAGYLMFYDFESRMMTEYNFDNMFSPLFEERLLQLSVFAQIGFTMFFWVVAYFRLTEKQI